MKIATAIAPYATTLVRKLFVADPTAQTQPPIYETYNATVHIGCALYDTSPKPTAISSAVQLSLRQTREYARHRYDHGKQLIPIDIEANPRLQAPYSWTLDFNAGWYVRPNVHHLRGCPLTPFAGAGPTSCVSVTRMPA